MTSFLTLNFTGKFQREDREWGRQIREGYEKNAISATAGIVFRFTRRRCYRALTVALAGLCCLYCRNTAFGLQYHNKRINQSRTVLPMIQMVWKYVNKAFIK